MTSLNFKGKSAVWNHHLSVPFHTLDEDKKLSLKGDNADENLIIEGDNLLALKALLPKYQGKVKCIYIDPPYNTGNEGWVYNDNVSSPTIKSWMGDVVARDDLSRHDKWLSMMTPRLKLLRELLSLEGVIFISIDENEIHNLKQVAIEIFGEENYISEFVWQKGSGTENDNNYVSTNHEYILCFAKYKKSAVIYYLPPSEQMLLTYDMEDKYVAERGKHYLRNLNDFSIGDRPGLHYDITCPDGTKLLGNEHRWRCDISKFNKRIAEDRIVFSQDEEGGWRVLYKQYAYETKEEVRTDAQGNILSFGKIPNTVLTDVGSTGDGKKELKEIFSDIKSKDAVFQYPKPSSLVRHLLTIGSKNDDIVLDSYAGSGTTGQAVIDLNKADGGHRKFILVQIEEEIKEKNLDGSKNVAYLAGYRWVHEITRERMIRSVAKSGKKVGFTYYKLGPAIDAETMLAGELPTYENFSKYVYYLATGTDHPDAKAINPKTYLVGKTERESIYLVYEQDMDKLKSLAITLKWAQDTQAKDKGKKIVYAPACYLDEESLDQFNIQFVSIPYNLFERNDL